MIFISVFLFHIILFPILLKRVISTYLHSHYNCLYTVVDDDVFYVCIDKDDVIFAFSHLQVLWS